MIRVRRSDSIDLITSPVSHTYRMTSPHLFTVRRIVSLPDLRMSTAQPSGILDTSSRLYGLSGSGQDYSLNRHKYYRSPRYDRWSSQYSTSHAYRPYYRDYGHRQHWGQYGRPPYLTYFASPTPASSFQWWYYPTAYYYPRVVRTDYLDSSRYLRDSSRYLRYREPYHVRSQFEYRPRYRRWAY